MNASLEGTLGSFLMYATNETTESLQFELITAEQYLVINEMIAIVTAAIALSGVCVNSLTVKTFLGMGVDDGVSITFLTLSVSDLCYTLVTLVQAVSAIMSSVEKRYGLWFKVDPFAVMFFSANVGVVIYMVTMLTTTYLATVRCLCVAKPLHFKNMFTRSKSSIVLASFPIIAVVSQAPIFAHMGMVWRFDPGANATKAVLWLSKDRERIKDIVRVIFDTYLSLVTQVIVVVCVVVMTMELMKSARFRQKQSSADRTLETGTNAGHNKGPVGKELTIVLQVVVISTIYIVCSVCKMFTAFYTLVSPKFDMGKPQQYLYLIMSSSRTAFDCINSSVNFFVYIAFNTKFRHACVSFHRK